MNEKRLHLVGSRRRFNSVDSYQFCYHRNCACLGHFVRKNTPITAFNRVLSVSWKVVYGHCGKPHTSGHWELRVDSFTHIKKSHIRTKSTPSDLPSFFFCCCCFKLKNNWKFKRANSTALGIMVQMIPPFVVLVFVINFGISKADIDN